MSRWTDFVKGKMSKYMKSEGSHEGAMKRLSREYKEKYPPKKQMRKPRDPDRNILGKRMGY